MCSGHILIHLKHIISVMQPRVKMIVNVRSICLTVPPITAFSFGRLIKSNYMELSLFSRCFTLKEQRTSLLPAQLPYRSVINIICMRTSAHAMIYRRSKVHKSQHTSKTYHYMQSVSSKRNIQVVDKFRKTTCGFSQTFASIF